MPQAAPPASVDHAHAPGNASGNTPESTAPLAEASDPQAVWAALLERVARRPSLSWLRYLQLDRLEADRAVLRPIPGRRELMGFATEERLQPVGQELAAVLGRRVRLVLETGAGRSGGSGTSAGPEAAGADTAGRAPAGSVTDRRRAMDLPLVKRVFDVFPDAVLIDARPASPEGSKKAEAAPTDEPETFEEAFSDDDLLLDGEDDIDDER